MLFLVNIDVIFLEEVFLMFVFGFCGEGIVEKLGFNVSGLIKVVFING